MFVDCIDSDPAGVPLHTPGGSGLRREGAQLWLRLGAVGSLRIGLNFPKRLISLLFSVSETVVVFCRENRCSLRS